MSGKRIVFTGGTGKAGRHAVSHLVGLTAIPSSTSI